MYAFKNCSKLTSVTIPSSVTTISRGAFNSCNLSKVVLPSVPPTLTNSDAFSNNSTDLLFYLPSSTDITAYLNSSGWSDYNGKYTTNAVHYVTFAPGSAGSGSMTRQAINGYTPLNAMSFSCTKEGYYFTGWKDDAGNFYTDKQRIATAIDITLTAQWNDEYEVDFYKTLNDKAVTYCSWILPGGVTKNTGTQEFYGCDISTDGGKTYQVLDTSYYQGNFGNRKNGYVKLINTCKVHYGSYINVWVTYDPAFNSKTCNIDYNGATIRAGGFANYVFRVTQKASVTFMWHLTSQWNDVTDTSGWHCSIKNPA
jgi:uncharacterized repeat protein (TIGR02543 family)